MQKLCTCPARDPATDPPRTLAQLFSLLTGKSGPLPAFSQPGLEDLCYKQLLLLIAMTKQRYLGMADIVLCFVAESEVGAFLTAVGSGKFKA